MIPLPADWRARTESLLVAGGLGIGALYLLVGIRAAALPTSCVLTVADVGNCTSSLLGLLQSSVDRSAPGAHPKVVSAALSTEGEELPELLGLAAETRELPRVIALPGVFPRWTAQNNRWMSAEVTGLLPSPSKPMVVAKSGTETQIPAAREIAMAKVAVVTGSESHGTWMPKAPFTTSWLRLILAPARPALPVRPPIQTPATLQNMLSWVALAPDVPSSAGVHVAPVGEELAGLTPIPAALPPRVQEARARVPSASAPAAATNQTKVAYVAGSAVNVRSKPSQGATKLFVLAEGDRVSVLETVGSWTRIRSAKGRTGWVFSTVTNGDPARLLPGTSPKRKTVTPPRTKQSLASVDSAVSGKSTATAESATATSGRATSNFGLFKLLPAGPLKQKQAGTPAPRGSVVRAGGVTVRSGPGKGNSALFNLSGGTPVTVLGEQGGWTRVKDQSGRTGWAYSPYVVAR